MGLGIVFALPSETPTNQIESLEEDKLEIVHVNGNVSMLIGLYNFTGGNIGVSAGNDGLLIVDDGLTPFLDDIKLKLTELKTCSTCGDVEFLLNTHWHFDHVENNADFGKDDTVIIAHDNVRELLLGPQELKPFGMAFDTAPKEALPVVTFDESVSVHFNDEEIKVIHLPNGHTNSDSIVYFTESNVLHLGDQFVNGMYPFVDLAHGGSVEGMARNMIQVANTFPADVKIIPGHGGLGDMDDLLAYNDMLTGTIQIVQAHINEEFYTLEEIQDIGFPAEYQIWDMGSISESMWIEMIYVSLTDD